MNQHYQNKSRLFFTRAFLFLMALLPLGVMAQITVSTAAGANYSGGLGTQAGTPGAITFVLQNNNTQAVIVKKIDYFASTAHPDNVYKLWFSTTSLSGPATIASPAWTLVATGNPVTAAANGVTTVLDNLDNLNISIPPSTQYRFALETTVGIVYSGASTATTPPLPLPTPNTFTSGGVTLKVGGASITAASVGYGGLFPTPTNTPRFFTGSVTLGFCPSTVVADLPSVSADTVLCGLGGSATLRVTGGNLNDAAYWKWYSTSCGGTAIGTGPSITVTPTATTTYYVRGEGGCSSAPGSCAAINVAVRPVPGTPTVNPVSPICLGSLQALTINPLALTPASVTVNSAALSIAIPDNVATGINTTLSVAGVPTGATVTGVDVVMNITHTYVSDLIINLKAPNGQIANLSKFVTGTGAEGENFVNTMITSDVTANELSSGTAPYTGVFKADLINTAVGTGAVQNPAGFASNAAAFNALYTVPNGTWTLAMADGGPADLGTLTSWSITIRYTTSAPSNPAVWTPGATLYTDAAGTIPYDGVTPRFVVYAKPSVTTTYSAASALNGCYSPETTVDVVVNNPATITDAALPANVKTCEFSTVNFKAAATGTAPTYQWEVSTDNGVNFASVPNTANYDGATTDSLTVKGMPASWTKYQYRCKVTSTSPCTDIVYSRVATMIVDKTPVATLTLDGAANLLPGMVSTLNVTSDTTAVTYNWLKNGLPFEEATGNSTDVTIDNQGIFTVQIVDRNGCTGLSNEVVIADSVSSKLFIYPNPAPNQRFVVSYYSLKGNVLPRQLVIYDSKGTMVYNQVYTVNKPYGNMEVDFSLIGRGIYVVNLLDRSGKRIATGKVVVR